MSIVQLVSLRVGEGGGVGCPPRAPPGALRSQVAGRLRQLLGPALTHNTQTHTRARTWRPRHSRAASFFCFLVVGRRQRARAVYYAQPAHGCAAGIIGDGGGGPHV